MPAHHFRELLDLLEEQLQTEECDRSFAFTEGFLKEHHLEEDKVIVWLVLRLRGAA
ncbi:DUF2695 domain-containing protein [Pontibacter diazotrophicus]|uniref:DUF2695 domain-containing protein n=1 Tax=Pontibacter diazotrophicus TaxID=1400979 RepID=A0A3D8L371_9BACT|nr:DUF2695 domain-containing protein [Pontibacter diazotrophicus]RDV11919.1 DUF2695 domain-containing protein [Pontibacter diazotrophicus]